LKDGYRLLSQPVEGISVDFSDVSQLMKIKNGFLKIVFYYFLSL